MTRRDEVVVSLLSYLLKQGIFLKLTKIIIEIYVWHSRSY